MGKWIWLTSLPVIFVSVYPSRDIGKLQGFVKRFNADFVGLGAKDAELNKLAKTLVVYREVVQDHPMELASNYLIGQAAGYLVLNPNLEMIGFLNNPYHALKIAPALGLIV